MRLSMKQDRKAYWYNLDGVVTGRENDVFSDKVVFLE